MSRDLKADQINITSDKVDVQNVDGMSKRQYLALKYLIFGFFMLLSAQITDSWLSVLLGFGFIGAFFYNDWKL